MDEYRRHSHPHAHDERGAFMTAWREKKFKGVVLTITGTPASATRLEPFVHQPPGRSHTARSPRSTNSKPSGARAGRKKREALLA